ncbi:glycine zipper 2TM domain-containing protein [Variovorax sp. NFACC27]|uniref:glycine zipper 2TM domain-containing protein n=1 Tax=unclassified Variovorax TaxID=663243 RepID=UPI0008976A8C|nr:Glycine zipper 2TM domain-containing protein [Variovorax sp. NFACC28]SEG00042.1 Glycine zipper 2TM domain-containing protein [Variovorax sp. NFACC29]SFB95171.1 Glycine zipper 2TM domain-containing protein [Variovorax sp. NFACC26]SFF81064.1 Glycine zipper 2TM domain-containing protein [Variovorax sp. NFACC27]
MDPTSPFNPPPGQPVTRSPKALWAVIGALSVAVVALGGVLLHRQQGPDAAASVPPPVVVAAAPATPNALDDFKPEALQAPPAMPAPVPAAAPVRAPEPAPVQAMQPAVPQAPAPAAAPVAAAQPAPPPCAVCGRVESVHPVQRAQKTTGVGAVAGGVVGGLVGNQFGHGNGRVATTVLGAVGGGFAGNAVEKHVRTVTVYEVGVRMDDGALRTVETKTAPPIGKPVTLRRGVLRPADGHK